MTEESGPKVRRCWDCIFARVFGGIAAAGAIAAMLVGGSVSGYLPFDVFIAGPAPALSLDPYVMSYAGKMVVFVGFFCIYIGMVGMYPYLYRKRRERS